MLLNVVILWPRCGDFDNVVCLYSYLLLLNGKFLFVDTEGMKLLVLVSGYRSPELFELNGNLLKSGDPIP